MSLPLPWSTALAERLEHTRLEGRWRERRHRGINTLDFASNDYLGLANDPRIASALSEAAATWGTGAGAAQLLGGFHPLHQELEQQLASWVGRPAAVVFSTGYMANLGLLGALVDRGDAVIQDKRNHASLLDGARLSGAELRRFRHNDGASLDQQLARPARRKLVVVESVYSMDGDRAPLSEIAEIAACHNALLCIDEAHALGVDGPEGAGVAAGAGIDPELAPVLMGTFGKALGTFGAFVAGPQAVIDTLVNHARSHIFTTAPPPSLAAATLCALDICRSESWRRERLKQHIDQFQSGLAETDLPVPRSTSPIQPLVAGDSQRALKISAALLALGFHAPAIRPPTVPAGQARLRITLNAGHQTHDIQRLLGALGSCWTAPC